MARRKARRKTRRKFKGVNVVNAAEGYMQASVGTELLFKCTPLEFAMDKTGGGSSGVITARELLDSLLGGYGGVAANTADKYYGGQRNAFGAIQSNLSKGWANAAIKSVGIRIGFSAGKALTRKPRAAANRMMKKLGVGDLIRV